MADFVASIEKTAISRGDGEFWVIEVWDAADLKILDLEIPFESVGAFVASLRVEGCAARLVSTDVAEQAVADPAGHRAFFREQCDRGRLGGASR